MQVHKFGGASLQDAAAVKNIVKILENEVEAPAVLIFSAMAKTTNALEEVIYGAYHNSGFSMHLEAVHKFHLEMLSALLPGNTQTATQLDTYFQGIRDVISRKTAEITYDEFYDQLVIYGELISTFIVHSYLREMGFQVELLDAREVLKTDDLHRDSNVDWVNTCRLISERVSGNKFVVTQGFIGSSESGKSTTLGREGSDFTAAIFAFAVNASEVTIWKNVPGILNADPELIQNTVKYEELNYQEVAEMAYYGAKVIHPQTIRPLAMKNIPLRVKSFNKPENEGTLIHDCQLDYLPPNIILKHDQCLISFNMRDFSFISEKSLSVIFHMLDLLKLKINMMQVSALSFSICTDYKPEKVQYLLDSLEKEFVIRYNTSLRLLTIKNYDQNSLEKYAMDKVVLMEQRTRHNYQVVIR